MGCKVTIGAAGRSDAGSLWLYGGASCAAEQDTSSDMNDGPMLTTETSSPCEVRESLPCAPLVVLSDSLHTYRGLQGNDPSGWPGWTTGRQCGAGRRVV